MSSPLTTALRVAFRSYNAPTTTDAEKDAILAAMSEHSPCKEAEVAARIIQHRRDAAKQQLQLIALIEGIVGKHE